jgi:hypothetical protein
MRIFDLHVFTTKQLNRLKSDIRAASNKQVNKIIREDRNGKKQKQPTRQDYCPTM